jgi:ABC-type transporter Mla subunit MlaD
MTTPEADRLRQIKVRLADLKQHAYGERSLRLRWEQVCGDMDHLLSLVEQLQQERDELIAAMSRETFQSRRTMRVRMEQAEATSARLRTALEQLIEDWRNAASVCSIYNHVEGDAEDVFNKCAAELTAALGEPDGRRVPQQEHEEKA